MAGSSDIWRQVRDAVDIVDVIAEHLVLTKAGREFKCLCPFHDDHRPSMAVVPHKQIFNCFVCGTGGDVFKFVTLYHKMSMGEALRFLGQKAGVTIPELPRTGGGGRGAGSGGGGEEKSEREKVTEANERACTFFEKNLRSPTGTAGLDYLQKRGLTEETIEKFRLGYSPEGWTGLVTAAGRIGLPTQLLVASGLAKQRGDGSLYDAFRGRVMFPIFDAMGRVIAFGGRILVEKRDEAGNVVEAKYLNSPESRAFNKSESLYGINFAKRSIIASQTVVIVEGYMDVIACHQAGVTNVVATLGTALTAEHARILRRFCKTVVLVFDSDEAGHRAGDRALETLIREPLDIKIASVADGKDPCDFCMTHGGAPFKEMVDHATDALTYQWSRMLKSFSGTDSLAGKQAAIEQFMRFVAPLIYGPSSGGRGMGGDNPIRKSLLMVRISELTGLSQGQVSQTLEKMAAQHAAQNRYTNRPAPVAPTTTEEAEGNPASAGGENTSEKGEENNPPSTGGSPLNIPKTAGAQSEGWVLGVLLTQPALYERVREQISLEVFHSYQPLAERVIEYLENTHDLTSCNLADFCAWLDLSESQMLVSQAIGLQNKAEQRSQAKGVFDSKALTPETELSQVQTVLGKVLLEEWNFLQGKHLQQEVQSEDPAARALRDFELAKQKRQSGQVGRIIGPKSMF